MWNRKALLLGAASLLFGCGEGVDVQSGARLNVSYQYCGPDENWEPEWEDFEAEVVERINAVRATGADCHSEGVFPAVPPVEVNDEIRCAARAHSEDMAVQSYFAHTSPNGELPWDRMEDEGYSYRAAGENIAAGYSTPEAVVAAWLASDGHCANLMSDAYIHTGVGYFFMSGSVYRYYWTQDFGSPAPANF